jgi:hypothetical protein
VSPTESIASFRKRSSISTSVTCSGTWSAWWDVFAVVTAAGAGEFGLEGTQRVLVGQVQWGSWGYNAARARCSEVVQGHLASSLGAVLVEEATAAHRRLEMETATASRRHIGSAEVFAKGAAYTTAKWGVHRAGLAARPKTHPPFAGFYTFS